MSNRIFTSNPLLKIVHTSIHFFTPVYLQEVVDSEIKKEEVKQLRVQIPRDSRTHKQPDASHASDIFIAFSCIALSRGWDRLGETVPEISPKSSSLQATCFQSLLNYLWICIIRRKLKKDNGTISCCFRGYQYSSQFYLFL